MMSCDKSTLVSHTLNVLSTGQTCYKYALKQFHNLNIANEIIN